MKTRPEERPQARGLKVAVVRSAFNSQVVDGLFEGARGALLEMGLRPKDLTVFRVPGAFELPLAAQWAARSGRFDALVALGAVVRGETDHYEHIAREASTGLAAAARETGVPVGFGVLTAGAEAQALRRSAPGARNKGAEAARAAVAMALLSRSFTERAPSHPPQRPRAALGAPGPERRKFRSRRARARRPRP